AAERLARDHGIAATVIDVRSLVPLDTQTILAEVVKTGRLYTVEENPRLCGWGAEVVSIVAEECFYDLDGPIIRITTPPVPRPAVIRVTGEDTAAPSSGAAASSAPSSSTARSSATPSSAAASPGTSSAASPSAARPVAPRSADPAARLSPVVRKLLAEHHIAD